MEQAYVLRLYDTDLLSFSLSEQGIEGLKAQIHSIDEEDRALFPLDLELTDDGLVKWLQRRVIPKNRAYVAEILKTYGLSVNDTKGIIDVCKGLSLNDSYWVVPQGFTGTFAQYNLYENRFSEILSLVAYTGIGQSDAAFTTSPELTTNGMLPKAWRFTEGEGIFDVRKRVCRENKIHMEFSETPVYQSAYIEGIGNLYEFDCGEGSGWMYRVNGEFPNYGCSRYTLADGDTVEWVYTCDFGADVGGGLGA